MTPTNHVWATVMAGAALVVLAAVVAGAERELASIGANGLLHPGRRRLDAAAAARHVTRRLQGAGVELEGWVIPAAPPRRGTLVYLHGVADNRGSAAGAAERFAARGFDVIAYDSRAHGGSGGDVCTYGYHEARDLARVLDVAAPGPIVVVGTSLGAAVGLQAAAEDPRISAVVAAESFSDLETIAGERAPWFFTPALIDHALRIADERGRFQVRATSPVAAAPRIQVPVLLVHGELDRETPPDHSRRIFDALRVEKQLLIVPGAGHNQSLQPRTWQAIDAWIDGVLTGEKR